MNKEQIKGTAKEVAGRVQEGVGKAINSPEQQLKGMGKQVEGKIEKNLGNLKEVIQDANKRTQP